MKALRHGVLLLPEHTWTDARARWTRAEELGFDHVWTYDHLRWRWLAERDWHTAVPLLAAAAAVTRRVRIGTMVASPAFRHPVTFAKELATLDDIAGGRLICGIGSGPGGYDERLTGGAELSPRARADRFAEFVAVTDGVLRRSLPDFEGRYFRVTEADLRPGYRDRPRPPFAIAATGPKAMEVVARHAQIWVTAGSPGWGRPLHFTDALPLLAAQSAQLDAACARISRDPGGLRRLVLTGAMIEGVTESVDSYRTACDQFAKLGFTDVVTHWPRDDFPYQGSEQVLEDIATTVLRPRGAS